MLPFSDVFALAETLDDAAVFVSTLAAELAVEDDDSAERAEAGVNAVVALLLAEASVDTAEVEVLGSDEFAPVAGVSSALPGDGAAPAPAPDDDPAVFAPPADGEEPPFKADWIYMSFSFRGLIWNFGSVSRIT